MAGTEKENRYSAEEIEEQQAAFLAAVRAQGERVGLGPKAIRSALGAEEDFAAGWEAALNDISDVGIPAYEKALEAYFSAPAVLA